MRKPTYNVYITQESPPEQNGDKNTYWTKVGVAFAHNIDILPALKRLSQKGYLQ